MIASAAVRVRRFAPRLRPTIRVRLTLLYSLLFSLCGTLLLTVVYVALDRTVGTSPTYQITTAPSDCIPPVGDVYVGPSPCGSELSSYKGQSFAYAKIAVLDGLFTASVVSLVLLTAISLVLGWWIAGRVLRPVHRITVNAQRLSWQNLHERIGLSGPRDEFTELADTFDALLDRLEAAFESQRRFVANASHELRTPLAVQRAAIQIGLSGGPPPSADQLAEVTDHLLDANRRAERLLDGLLVLAQSDSGLQERRPVPLAESVTDALDFHAGLAAAAGIVVTARLEPVTVLGDRVLLDRLAFNLVQNAVRHNHTGGSLHVDLTSTGGLVVTNTGPAIPPNVVPELFEPFRRVVAGRAGEEDGSGLGLSIVTSITRAHHGSIDVRANPEGGLRVAVAIPAEPSGRTGDGEDPGRPTTLYGEQQDLPRRQAGGAGRRSADHRISYGLRGK